MENSAGVFKMACIEIICQGIIKIEDQLQQLFIVVKTFEMSDFTHLHF